MEGSLEKFKKKQMVSIERRFLQKNKGNVFDRSKEVKVQLTMTILLSSFSSDVSSFPIGELFLLIQSGKIKTWVLCFEGPERKGGRRLVQFLQKKILREERVTDCYRMGSLTC